MDSEDMVFIDNVPSMTIVSSDPGILLQSVESRTNLLYQPESSPPKHAIGTKLPLDHSKHSDEPPTSKIAFAFSSSILGEDNATQQYPEDLRRTSESEDVVSYISETERQNVPGGEPRPSVRVLSASHSVPEAESFVLQQTPLPPPPPPPPGAPQFMSMKNGVPPMPPPPPPPPPAAIPGLLDFPVNPEDEVITPALFLPAQYSGESILDTSSRVVRIVPFKRNVLTNWHPAYLADYVEYEWILRYGITELWYEKPKKSHLKNLRTIEANRWTPEELQALPNARPVSLETPKVWASSALTLPMDDDIHDCAVGHALNDGYDRTCHQCTDEKSEALENTALAYDLVLSTCQASDPFIHGAHFNGRQIYKRIRCGSREAAVAEAFYAAGVNGWNVVFSCVTRLGEDFEDRSGKAKKVAELWMLAEEGNDETSVRIFY